jgi:transcriptional regulator with XRE-family HTH domain
MTQKQLAALADMAQPRISAMERPGETTFNIDTLVRLAAAFDVGLRVEFVPFSEMLDWENGFSQDAFNPTPIKRDSRFLNPAPVVRPTFLSLSSLLNVSRVEIASLQEAFAGQIRTTFDRYSQLSGGENILTGNVQLVQAEPIVRNLYQYTPPFIAAKELYTEQYLTGTGD